MKKLIILLITMLVTSCTTSIRTTKPIKPVTGEPYQVVGTDVQPVIVGPAGVTNTEQPLHMFVVMIVAVVASCACCVFYTRVVDRKDSRKSQTDDTDETTVING